MKKVYQTIVDKEKGNCMQAVVASLFEKDLEEVPNFINFGDDWYFELRHYLRTINEEYNPIFMYRKQGREKTLEEIAKYDGGVDGYFWGSVPSQTYNDATTHAVVCDINLNIVHDPNPNQKALDVDSSEIIDILTLKKFYIGVDGEFVEEKT